MRVVTTHTTADFDGFASMLAAHKLFPELMPVFSGTQEPALRAYLRQALCPMRVFNLTDVDLDAIDELVLVDTTDLSRIGPLGAVGRRPGVRLRCYDHHQPQERIPGAEYTICARGSTTTIFVELLRQRGISLSTEEATILALGLYEDTCSFTSVATSPADLEAAAYLLAHGAQAPVVFEYLHPALNPPQVRLLHQLLAGMEHQVIYGVEVNLATAEAEDYVPDAAAVVHRLREVTRLPVVVALVRMEDKVHCIARSRHPAVDVGELAQALGGGGHPSAASASVKERTLYELKGLVVRLLRAGVGRRLTARDLARPPLLPIPQRMTLRDAQALMQRRQREVLPVEQAGELVGLVSRRILDRALAYGLGGEAVGEYMDHGLRSVTSDAAIAEVEAALHESQGHGVLVRKAESGAPLGVICRRQVDLPLPRHEPLDGHGLLSVDAGSRVRGRFVAGLLRDRLPARIRELFAKAAEVADRQGVGVYVVGGLVRDLLLRLETYDVDLVIEGDGVAFARALGAELGAKVRSHQAFGTAVLIFPDGFRLDVATARTEFYAAPGTLPEVAQSSIRQDLGRRDFTINALAIKLNRPHAKRLIDFFGGEHDLKDRVIRVLHSLSFVDDPTRAFRAVRFEQRFGMRMGRQTLGLLKNALKHSVLSRVSGPRILHELCLIFAERDPLPALGRLDELGLLRCLHPALALEVGMIRHLQATREALAWHQLEFPAARGARRWMVYLLGLVRGLDGAEAGRLALRLGLRGKDVQRLLADHAQAPVASAALRQPGVPPAAIVAQCEQLSLDGVLSLMASLNGEPARQHVVRYLRELRAMTPLLSGDDLLRLGLPSGPLLGEALRALRERKLNGELPDRAAELQFVRRTFVASDARAGAGAAAPGR
ncbi:MAG: CBS domain-containing protein [Candidatus Tectomicrobia bacterium]|nr:CBS domain-containing protein [Candidatus Tectomicrobia bacterium]